MLLENSGMKLAKRYNPVALQQINKLENSWFKFVVDDENDIKYIINEIIEPNKLDLKKTILMPALSKQSEYFEKTKWIYEMGKKHNVRAVSRGHVAAWDRTVGV